MSLINSTAIPSGATDYEIEQSLRFNDDDSAYLSRTPSSASNRKTWTWSGWLKRGNLSTYQTIFAVDNGSTEIAECYWDGSDNSIFWHLGGGSNYRFYTNAIYRDSSAWYHIVCSLDTTISSPSGNNTRMKLYVNGEQVTSFRSNATPSLNYEGLVNLNTQHEIGKRNGTHNPLDGYLGEVHFIDGTAKAPTDFGETGTYGEWKPIQYSGSYGTNGFYLNFATASDMGDDKSGNTNDWAENNIAATDQMLDSPTNNFCTFNPLDVQTATVHVKEGNLRDNGGTNRSRGTMAVSSGKWYYEMLYVYQHHGTAGCGIRAVSGATISTVGNDTVQISHPYNSGISIVTAGSTTGDLSNGVVSGGSGDSAPGSIIGVMWDMDAETITFKSNNSALASAVTNVDFSGVSGKETMAPYFQIGGGRTVVANFGQDSSFAGLKTAQGNTDSNGIGDFFYEPANGYLALCTKNLPDVAVIPSEHFNTVLYTADDSNDHDITGVGFKPDLVFIKGRESTSDGRFYDAVRGANKTLTTTGNYAEFDENTASGLTSFDADGFNLGSNNGSWNNGSRAYVAWNWKAGNATLASNAFTQGSIASTCSRNVDSGFSIVSWTGTGTAGTVGHGLSSAPDIVIVKRRNATAYWYINLKNIPSQSAQDDMVGVLNETLAIDGYNVGTAIFSNTAPTSTLFNITTNAVVNANASTYIAYCFHSVEGYSKCSSFVGNGSADGVFVHTGFAVQWVMIKRTDDVSHWQIHDTARDPHNVMGYQLHANATDADASASAYYIDSVSNGFKLRMSHAGQNASGGNYIYIAFASVPSKFANAR